MDSLPATTPAQAHEAQSVLEIIGSSGTIGVGIIISLLILSCAAVYIFIERYLTISKALKSDNNFLNNIKMSLQSGNTQAAIALCRNTNSPMARVVEQGISRIGNPTEKIEKEMENVARVELYELEKNLGVLSLIARLSPMFGFVGTIMGVIKIFYDISLSDNLSIGVISGGLYQKMITSAAGLIVGIVSFVAYYILKIMVDRFVNRMERTSLEFLNFLQGPANTIS